MEYNKQCGCQPSKINVTDCAFHVPGNVCEAGEIIVGCRKPNCQTDAACTTYKAKEIR